MLSGFPRSLLQTLLCQNDRSNLRCEGTEEFIANGVFMCEACSTSYPVNKGIVYMLDSAELKVSEAREQEARDKEARTYDTRLQARFYKEVQPMMAWMTTELEGKKVIEYAAGTGRFTLPISALAKEVLAVDFSLASLAVLQKKLPSEARVGLVWADAPSLHTAPAVFDSAVSAQFIEHVALRNRREFYTNVATTLKPGATFFASVYHHDLRRRLRREPQNGVHVSGVPYHYFTRTELRRELQNIFKYIQIRLFDVTLPFESRVALPAQFGGVLSRICTYIPGLNVLGHLLFVEAKK